jgi:uncharacterized protein YigE (DUF2233 family)
MQLELMRSLRLALCTAALLLAGTAQGLEVQKVEQGGASYTVVRVKLQQDRLELFLNDAKQQPYRSFDAVAAALALRKRTLVFAMNAGMFEPDYTPVGLFIADGVEVAPMNTRAGQGNFYLKPNGVFIVGDAGAHVIDTAAYGAFTARPRLATQSGPLLVLDGTIHAAFKPESGSRHVRNGVGVTAGGDVVFVISETRVNFFEFASFFKDILQCPNALYLDGSISSLYLAGTGRNDASAWLGPIIGVVE